MSRDTSLRWVIDLSKDQADSNTFDRHYDDVTTDLAQMLVTNVTQNVDARDPEQPWPDEAVGLWALFWEGHHIHKAKLSELEAVNPDWRDETGRPVSWVLEDETDKTFRLYPSPDVAGTLTILFTERRDNMPDWLDFVVGLEVLRREFTHYSDHRNPELSAAIGLIRDKCMELIL